MCREGNELTSKAAALLRLLRNPITEFRLYVVARYSKEGELRLGGTGMSLDAFLVVFPTPVRGICAAAR